MGLLGEMTVRLGMDTSGLSTGASQATGILGALDAIPMAGIINTLLQVGGAALQMGQESVTAAAGFQAGMLKVQAYAGLSKQQTDAMGQSIMSMATQVGQSPKALADAIYPIVSSGYSASQALDILKLSAETAAASGAKTSTVADGLTTVLKTFSFSADKAGSVMDVLNKTVALGKTSFPELSAVIGKLSLSASSAHVPFLDMNAALSTLTVHGFPSTAQASNALGNLFTQVGIKTDAMEKHAKALGISFDAQKFSAMTLGDKIQYLNTATGGNQGAMLKMLGGSTLALKAFNALSSGSKDYKANLDALNHAQGTTAQVFATASQGYNLSMQKMGASMDVLKISIGNALLPAITGIIQKIAPVIQAFADWLQKSGVLTTAMQFLGTIATTISNFIGAIFTPILQTLTQWFGSTGNSANALAPIFNNVSYIIQGIGSFLAATFLPIWQELVAMFQNQMIPAWNNLLAGIQPLMPELQGFAMFIGGVLVLAISVLSGAIGGLLKAFAGLLTGVIQVWGGIVTYISGAIQVITGIIAFFADLFTGKFDKLGGDLGAIWGGIVRMFVGVWQVIQGVFVGAINMIIGLINGFVQGALGPINALLHAAGQSAISVGQIPMLSAPATQAANIPTYQSQRKSTGAGASFGPSTSLPNIMQQMSQQPATTAPGAQQQSLAQQLASPAAQAPTVNAVNNANSAAASRHAAALAAAAQRKAASAAKHQQVLAAQAARHAQAAAHHQQVLAAAAAKHQQVLVNQAAKKATTAAHHAQVLAAAASRKQQAAAHHAATQAAAAQRHAATVAAKAQKAAQTAANHAASQAAAAQRHAQQLTGLKNVQQAVTSSSQQMITAVQQPLTMTPVDQFGTPLDPNAATGGNSNSSNSRGSNQPLTIIVELDGQQLVQYVGDYSARLVRLQTGLKAA